MPKNSSASLRARVRAYAAEHGVSYVAAHARITAGSLAVTSDSDKAFPEELYPYRVADAENRGWFTRGDGLYEGFDPTGSFSRPLPDALLAELAVQPGEPTLSVDQVAAIVELLPLGRRVSTADEVAERLELKDVTGARVGLIIQRIETEKTERYGYEAPRFRLDERRLIEARPLEEIERHFGPWRPVEPPTEADHEELRSAFELAGRKLITSVASALEQVFDEARDRFGSWRTDPSGTANYAWRTLTAGRPGSWEADAVMNVVWFGNGLNLYPHKDSLPVETMRETGPNPNRVHVEARDQIAAVLRRWTDSPDRYTEVPETLAAMISSYADEKYGPEGWKKIADQWLQPGGMAVKNFGACYRLLYSTSEYFDYTVI